MLSRPTHVLSQMLRQGAGRGEGRGGWQPCARQMTQRGTQGGEAATASRSAAEYAMQCRTRGCGRSARGVGWAGTPGALHRTRNTLRQLCLGAAPQATPPHPRPSPQPRPPMVVHARHAAATHAAVLGARGAGQAARAALLAAVQHAVGRVQRSMGRRVDRSYDAGVRVAGGCIEQQAQHGCGRPSEPEGVCGGGGGGGHRGTGGGGLWGVCRGEGVAPQTKRLPLNI
jgi:hypothetical protein